MCFAIICKANVFATDSLILIKKLPVLSNTITTDKTGNLYIATKSNCIYKYNIKGDSTGFYSAVRRGNISQIDASNPMQIVLFSAEQNVVTLLDRLLVEKNKIDFKKAHMYNCPSVSNSADGDLWVYDAFENALRKVNDKLQVQNNSFNFTQQFGQEVKPTFLTEQERNLFVVDSSYGILKFDVFGNYVTTYHFKTKEIQFVNGQLIFLDNGVLNLYNIQSLVEKKLQLPNASNILQARVERNIIYIRYADAVYMYKLDL